MHYRIRRKLRCIQLVIYYHVLGFVLNKKNNYESQLFFKHYTQISHQILPNITLTILNYPQIHEKHKIDAEEHLGIIIFNILKRILF
jgi:hypothetical protein